MVNGTVPNPGDLTDGQTVTATATDQAGNPSLPGSAVVDAVAPTVAVTTALTNDSTPALTGRSDKRSNCSSCGNCRV